MTASAVRSQIVENVAVAPSHYRLRVDFDGTFRPGEFFMLGELARESFLMPRALSGYRGGDGWVDFLYKVVGRGTRELATYRPGDAILIWGPLGHGFADIEGPQLVIAGGIGVAGVVAWAEMLATRGRSPASRFGARMADDLVGADDLARASRTIVFYTEDGSRGQRGRVTDGLADAIRAGGHRGIAACGPSAMLDAVARIARSTGIKAQLSVESPMACGMGVCLGCSVAVDGRYQRACTEGPVFESARWGEGPA